MEDKEMNDVISDGGKENDPTNADDGAW